MKKWQIKVNIYHSMACWCESIDVDDKKICLGISPIHISIDFIFPVIGLSAVSISFVSFRRRVVVVWCCAYEYFSWNNSATKYPVATIYSAWATSFMMACCDCSTWLSLSVSFAAISIMKTRRWSVSKRIFIAINQFVMPFHELENWLHYLYSCHCRCCSQIPATTSRGRLVYQIMYSRFHC